MSDKFNENNTPEIPNEDNSAEYVVNPVMGTQGFADGNSDTAYATAEQYNEVENLNQAEVYHETVVERPSTDIEFSAARSPFVPPTASMDYGQRNGFDGEQTDYAPLHRQETQQSYTPQGAGPLHHTIKDTSYAERHHGAQGEDIGYATRDAGYSAPSQPIMGTAPQTQPMQTGGGMPTGEYVVTPNAKPIKPKKPVNWGIVIAFLFTAAFIIIVALAVAVFSLYNQGTTTGSINPSNSAKAEEHLKVSEITTEGLSTAEIAAKAMNSVCGINVYSSQQVAPVSEGSGIVLSAANGHIVTNAHVVTGAAAVTIRFSEGEEYNAQVIGLDERTDLAVLKVDPKEVELTEAEFGDSDKVALGDDVVAMGNAGGFYNSVTRGVISGLDREISTSIGINLLQTDAAINPGNSGGALLNAHGQVIAINSAKLVGSDIDSMGFAIPISEAKPIIDSLISFGSVVDRAQLGVTIMPMNGTTGAMYGLPEVGLYITQITPNSNLYKAGVTRGDILLKANGVDLIESTDLILELEKYKTGDEMTFTVGKADGQEAEVKIILQSSNELSAPLQ